jgi:short-subunit dehydrogenase
MTLGRIAVVAGASGNVGPFVVQALLQRGASVVAPSRSEEKLRGLREHLRRHVPTLRRLHTFVGDLGDEHEATVARRRIREKVGTPRRRGGVGRRPRHRPVAA